MSDERAPDLSRIVNLIMENPKLIEEISHLADAKSQSEEDDAPVRNESEYTAAQVDMKSEGASDTRGRRQMLLSAIKPYLSKERAGAIDSMMSIVDIIEVMKQR